MSNKSTKPAWKSPLVDRVKQEAKAAAAKAKSSEKPKAKKTSRKAK